MIAKVVLGTMQDAKKLVNIVEHIPYDAELCNGRYVVNAKSMLGVLSMPEFEDGELHVHTDNEMECEEILEKLLEQGLGSFNRFSGSGGGSERIIPSGDQDRGSYSWKRGSLCLL